MPNLFIYTTPDEATVTLTLDSGELITGSPPMTANGRDDAHRLQIPPNTTGGALLEVTAADQVPFTVRGLMIPPTGPGTEAHFQLDDVHLADLPPPPALPPKPNPNLDPFAIIQAIYEQGTYDLSTKQGCGEYTEACCLNLFMQQSRLWAHIRKEPAQNQWQGHAVDAIQLFVTAGTTGPGIYDIILDTESPNAQPAWSYRGPADPNLWMSPIL